MRGVVLAEILTARGPPADAVCGRWPHSGTGSTAQAGVEGCSTRNYPGPEDMPWACLKPTRMWTQLPIPAPSEGSAVIRPHLPPSNPLLACFHRVQGLSWRCSLLQILSRQQEPVEKKEAHLMDFMAPVYQIRKGQELMYGGQFSVVGIGYEVTSQSMAL